MPIYMGRDSIIYSSQKWLFGPGGHWALFMLLWHILYLGSALKELSCTKMVKVEICGPSLALVLLALFL